RLRAEGARWAVVLDGEEKLHGWISAARAEGAEGSVGEQARRMEAWLPVGAPLKRAFATMLQHDAGWIAVLDPDADHRFLGVLTPAALHEALRRSTAADSRAVPRQDVALETVHAV
ncbi:CBS domain-containing protein, partial [Streptomyces sp. ZG43]